MSRIEWTEETWNPTTGCTRISEGCSHCYIERTPPMRMAHRRFDGPDIGATTGVWLHPERLEHPLKWRKPRRVFVNSMSDLFHEDVPDEFIARVWATMALAPQHTFQVLTKRPARMRSLLRGEWFLDQVGALAGSLPGWPLRNVWVGVSVETQKWANIRIPLLLDTPAAVRWISAEPMLGPIDLFGDFERPGPAIVRTAVAQPTDYGTGIEYDWDGQSGLDWVVCGGETGPHARPMHPDWARSLRDQCCQSGVPFFFKQWGDWGPTTPTDRHGRYDMSGCHTLANDGTLYAPDDLNYPDGPRWGEAFRADHGHARLIGMYRVGKKRAGRELDRRTWDEYPTDVPT